MTIAMTLILFGLWLIGFAWIGTCRHDPGCQYYYMDLGCAAGGCMGVIFGAVALLTSLAI